MLSHWSRSLFLLCSLLSLLLAGCGGRDKEYEAMMQPDETTELKSGWQYRWGDSPMDNGSPAWAKELVENGSEWSDFELPASSPPHRPRGGENVWLRTTIPELHGRSDYLYILGFDQAAEIYLDGKRVYGWGNIGREGKGRFAGYVWHLLALPKEASGKRIYFRVWSSHVNIGVIGKVFVGPKSAFVRSMFEESLTNFIVMIIVMFMGIMALAMFIARRTQTEYFYFFVHTLIGVWLFTRTSMRYFIGQNAELWMILELVAFACASIGLIGFSDAVFGTGRSRFPRWYARSGFLLVAGVVALGIFNFQEIMRTLLPIQLYMLAGIIIIVVQLFVALRRGMFDAKVVMVGLLTLLAVAVAEILVAMGLIFPSLMGKATLAPWGLLGFVFSLGAVLVFRFAAVYRRVGRLKGQLEDILVGTKEMAVAREKLQAAELAVKLIMKEIDFRPACSAELYLRHEKEGMVQYYAAQVAKDHRVISDSELRRVEAGENDTLERMLERSDVQVTPDEKLLVPIYWGVQKSGLIVFDALDVKKFGLEESGFVSTLVSSLALSLSNIDFLAETKEKAALDAELAAAQAVQESLLPASTNYPGVEIVSLYTPAGKTGGDWIGHYFDRVNHRLNFYVADVTGHGFAASLLTGVACGGVYSAENLLTAIARRTGESHSAEFRLDYVANIVNAIVLQTGREKLMMTMALVSLDLLTGEVTYLNCGHNPPYLVSKTEKRAKGIPGSGSRLGFTSEPKFETVKRQLQPGDSLFMFTDGLVENTGPDGKSTFSERDLRRLLGSEEDAKEVHGRIMDAARAVWKDHLPADDVTALLIQWKGPVAREVLAVRGDGSRDGAQ